jgi:hypothetical protein
MWHDRSGWLRGWRAAVFDPIVNRMIEREPPHPHDWLCEKAVSLFCPLTDG